MNNITTSLTARQEIYWDSSTFQNLNSALNNKSPRDLVLYAQEQLTRSELKVFQVLWSFTASSNIIFPSMNMLAGLAHVGLSTVKSAIKKLHASGIFYKERRHYTSNRYYLHVRYTVKAVRNLMNSFLVNFRFSLFSLSLLVSNTALADNQPLLILKGREFLSKIHLSSKAPNSAREVMTWMDGKFLTEKESVMDKQSFALLKNNSDKFPLTLRGLMKLSVFPVQVIEHLLSKPFNVNASDPFAYLYKCGANFAKQIGLMDPDFSLYNKLEAQMELTYQPYIDADLFERVKQSHLRQSSGGQTPQRGYTQHQRRKQDTGKQQAQAFSELQGRIASADEAQKQRKYERVRALGFEPETLSFNQMSRLLKGTVSPEELRRELPLPAVSDNNLPALSTYRPQTEEQFLAVRAEVVAYFQAKIDRGQTLSQYEDLVFNSFKDVRPEAKANPFDEHSPTVGQVLEQLRIVPPKKPLPFL